MKSMRNFNLGLLIVALSLIVISCQEKTSVGPGQNPQSNNVGSISLIAANMELYAVPGRAVTTTVTATVTDTNGTALSGVLVTFSTPTIGSISSTQDSTDLDGKVSVTFNSQGQYGLAAITASTPSAGNVISKTINISVFPLTGLADNITLALSPDLLYLSNNVDDSVQVTVRVMDSLNVGIPGMYVSLSTTQGVIGFADTTENTGTVVSYLHTNGDFGLFVVSASVYTDIDTSTVQSSGPITWPGLKTGTVQVPGLGYEVGSKATEPRGTDEVVKLTATDTLWVFPVDQQIGELVIGAWPATINVAQDSVSSTTIIATVLDPNNNGIPGVPILFGASNGYVSVSSGNTDSTGSKTTTFYTLPNVFGVAHIWAVVGPYSDTCNVTINATAASNGSILIQSNKKLIYADMGLSPANITALLKDADHQVISGVSIVFTSDYGTVNSPVLTDSTGQAHALFQDIGLPSYPDSAMVIAKYPPLNLADTVNIMIADARDVSQIVLNTGASTLKANGVDSTTVLATVYLMGNALAPPGTEVHFVIGGDNRGRFSGNVNIAYVGGNGSASTVYIAGSTKGVDSLFAIVDTVQSNVVVMTLHAGPPSDIVLSIVPSTMPVNSPNPAVVTAIVTDTTGNRVEDNTPVFFSTTLGSLFPVGAQTINGVATTSLSPSTNAGDAWIKAQSGAIVDSAIVSFMPSTPSQIGLSAQSPVIQVQGTGGSYQTEIHADVTDASGNLVGNDVMVHFRIENNGFPFGGVNLNNHGIEDSTMTNGGIATVVLNAGTASGPVTIRAWTFDGEGMEIWASGPLVTIVAGPPSFIDVGINSETPRDGGGDIWQVEVSALVRDIHNNQVVDSTAVHFYSDPDSVAEIWGDAFTGNDNWAGSTNEGTAYTTLSYHSVQTFNWADIYAYCVVDGDSIIGSIHYQMPLADGRLGLNVIPTAWNFSHPPVPPGDPAVMEVRAFLTDGHNNAINGATIIFSSTKGYFYWFQSGSGGVHFEKITGPQGFVGEPVDPAGYAICFMRTSLLQAFPDPGAIETTAQVSAVVLGYSTVSADPVTVTFTRDG